MRSAVEKIGLATISWESGQIVLRHPVSADEKGRKQLADLGPEIRGGKRAYWCSFGEMWSSKLLDVLGMIVEH